MVYRFNGVELTEESMKKARQFYIDNAYKCIESAKAGKFFVNDLDTYIANELRRVKEMEDGTDLSLTLLQRAYYEQTGESVALLP